MDNLFSTLPSILAGKETELKHERVCVDADLGFDPSFAKKRLNLFEGSVPLAGTL